MPCSDMKMTRTKKTTRRKRTQSYNVVRVSGSKTDQGLEADTRGTVAFTAKSMVNGVIDDHTEKSLFKKKGGDWFYVKALG